MSSNPLMMAYEGGGWRCLDRWSGRCVEPVGAGCGLSYRFPSFSILYGFVVSQPIVMKLFTHINDNILRQATLADF